MLFFEKGKRRLSDLGVADVLQSPASAAYPAEKPSALSEVLSKQSCAEGELVVDPFTGSGPRGVPALTLAVAMPATTSRRTP